MVFQSQKFFNTNVTKKANYASFLFFADFAHFAKFALSLFRKIRISSTYPDFFTHLNKQKDAPRISRGASFC